MEESFIACYWSLLIHKNYMPDDFTVFEKWVGTYLNNWASCDTLCNHDRGYVLHSAIFQIVANNFLEVLLRSYWHVAVFVILTKSNK